MAENKTYSAIYGLILNGHAAQPHPSSWPSSGLTGINPAIPAR